MENGYEEGCTRGAIEIKSEEGVYFIEYPPANSIGGGIFAYLPYGSD
jgi:hypothetical protein